MRKANQLIPILVLCIAATLSAGEDTAAGVPLKNKDTDPIAAKINKSPLQIVKTASFKMKPGKVFEVLGDHQNLPKYLPIVHDVKIDNSMAEEPGGKGCVRTCTMADGGVLTEKIVHWDPGKAYAYSISNDNPMMLSEHTGIFHVKAAKDGTTLLTWSQYFQHPQAAMVAQEISGLMDMILTKLTAELGGEKLN